MATFVTAAVAFDLGCVIWAVWQFHAYRHVRISLTVIFLAIVLTTIAGVMVRLSWMDRPK